jgi:lipid II:glycine glycyltransferase (peptidoglycan interpeptide bridge formation enzyme)
MNQHTHLLQHVAWGELKSQFGWRAVQVQSERAAAQILFRQLPLGLTIGYVPKGPTVDWADVAARQEILTLMHLTAKRQRAIFLKLEPHVWQDSSEQVTTFLSKAGFMTADTIQPPGTIIVDIRGNEDEILAAMKQKTRYNIRLAQKKGVTVRVGSYDEIVTFYELSELTAERDAFGIHSLAYYQAAYRLFGEQCALLLAEAEGQPLAGLMVFYQGDTAYYLYGASSNEQRQLMPTYLIQWEAMRWAQARGCQYYDLWGIPAADVATLEAEFEQHHEGLWGVYRFKRGFGGEVKQAIGAVDYVYQPWLYRLYRWAKELGIRN